MNDNININRTQSVVMSNLSQSDGSAIYSFGDTVIQTYIYGPREISQHKEDVDKATVEVVFRKRIRPTNRDNADIKLMEEFISHNCRTIMHLTLHPRTLISIFLQEMESNGSLVSTCINAVCFALLDSGFPLKYLLAATSAVITSDGQIIVNASNEQENEVIASFTIVFDSVDHKIVSTLSEGNFTFSQFQQCIQLCKNSANDIFKFYRDTVQKRFN